MDFEWLGVEAGLAGRCAKLGTGSNPAPSSSRRVRGPTCPRLELRASGGRCSGTPRWSGIGSRRTLAGLAGVTRGARRASLRRCGSSARVPSRFDRKPRTARGARGLDRASAASAWAASCASTTAMRCERRRSSFRQNGVGGSAAESTARVTPEHAGPIPHNVRARFAVTCPLRRPSREPSPPPR